MRRRFRRAFGVVVLGVGLLGLPELAAADEARRAPRVEVIAQGLKNPRGIAFGPNHALYVAEAGRGGDGPCVPGLFEGETCIGRTGAITRIWRGRQERVVRGLPSHAGAGGFAAIGPHDVAPISRGRLYVTVGLFGPLDMRQQFGFKGRSLGRLLLANVDGDRRTVADLLRFETRANPAGGPEESNPYGLLVHGRTRLVADASANDLVAVGRNGQVRTVAVFRNRLVDFQGQEIPMEPVPTTVVRGPDGAYYVGQLTGFPFPVGGARVYRVVPGERPEVYRRGFTNIADIAFGHDGSLYVLEMAHNSFLADNPEGALIRVAPNGRRSIVLDGLTFPAGLAIGSRGKLYVTNCSVCPGGGEVLRITR